MLNTRTARPHRAAALAALVACAASLPAGARAETSIVADVASGKVLSAKNASARWYPASTTKLMTAYVALKAIADGRARPDTPVVITKYAAGQAPSKMGYAPGSVIRLDTALRMMLVKSANDVAVAIGQTLGQDGSLLDFIAQMNRAAAELGMADTAFINPNGLPGAGQHSSAKDLAILAVALRRDFPEYKNLFGIEAINTGKQTIRNTNPLLGRYDGADGMKTGYICASGFNLVGSATRNGRTLVAVVLGANGPIVRDRLVADILETGFRTDPASVTPTLGDWPAASGAPADISAEICSAEGQKERANERQAEAKRPEHNSGSPFMHERKSPPVAIPVALGQAAAGTVDGREVPAGITRLVAFGIPIPTARPDFTASADGASPFDAALRPSAPATDGTAGPAPEANAAPAAAGDLASAPAAAAGAPTAGDPDAPTAGEAN